MFDFQARGAEERLAIVGLNGTVGTSPIEIVMERHNATTLSGGPIDYRLNSTSLAQSYWLAVIFTSTYWYG